MSWKLRADYQELRERFIQALSPEWKRAEEIQEKALRDGPEEWRWEIQIAEVLDILETLRIEEIAEKTIIQEITYYRRWHDGDRAEYEAAAPPPQKASMALPHAGKY